MGVAKRHNWATRAPIRLFIVQLVDQTFCSWYSDGQEQNLSKMSVCLQVLVFSLEFFHAFPISLTLCCFYIWDIFNYLSESVSPNYLLTVAKNEKSLFCFYSPFFFKILYSKREIQQSADIIDNSSSFFLIFYFSCGLICWGFCGALWKCKFLIGRFMSSSLIWAVSSAYQSFYLSLAGPFS